MIYLDVCRYVNISWFYNKIYNIIPDNLFISLGNTKLTAGLVSARRFLISDLFLISVGIDQNCNRIVVSLYSLFDA